MADVILKNKNLVTVEPVMNRNLALEVGRVTENAAIAVADWIGRGDKISADQAAVDKIRACLNTMFIDGEVVIGEGEKDEAPQLYIGEKVGAEAKSGEVFPKVDIALDPLDGTTMTAKAGPNAMTVVALGERGAFLPVPDMYVEKLLIGDLDGTDIVSLDNSVEQNLKNVAKAKKVDVSDLRVCLLDRDRHMETIEKVRETGARAILIPDADLPATMGIGLDTSPYDVYMGIGGGPEGVLAAAAVHATGGDMQIRLHVRNDKEKSACLKSGIKDLTKIYTLDEIAKGDIIVSATGVTTGPLLKGLERKNNIIKTHTVIMRSISGTLRYIETTHNLNRKELVD